MSPKEDDDNPAQRRSRKVPTRNHSFPMSGEIRGSTTRTEDVEARGESVQWLINVLHVSNHNFTTIWSGDRVVGRQMGFVKRRIYTFPFIKRIKEKVRIFVSNIYLHVQKNASWKSPWTMGSWKKWTCSQQLSWAGDSYVSNYSIKRILWFVRGQYKSQISAPNRQWNTPWIGRLF